MNGNETIFFSSLLFRTPLYFPSDSICMQNFLFIVLFFLFELKSTIQTQRVGRGRFIENVYLTIFRMFICTRLFLGFTVVSFR